MNTYYVEIPEFIGPFKALDTGESWNGWECPAFDFPTACDVGAALIQAGQIAGYDEASRTFFVVLGDSGNETLATLAGADEDTIETYGPLIIAPFTVWPLGAWGWCWEPSTTGEVALEFVRILREDLTSEQFEEVRRRNATPEYARACASHDFCDANMPMEEAFTKVIGHAPAFAPENDDPDFDAKMTSIDAESAIWNAAWDIAKRDYLTAK